VNDHIYLALVHSHRNSADGIGRKAHFAQKLFDPYGRLTCRRKIVTVYIEVKIYFIGHF
jgi:ribonucleotide reductase alpha subunit